MMSSRYTTQIAHLVFTTPGPSPSGQERDSSVVTLLPVVKFGGAEMATEKAQPLEYFVKSVVLKVDAL
jgi:hypothetical protein